VSGAGLGILGKVVAAVVVVDVVVVVDLVAVLSCF